MRAKLKLASSVEHVSRGRIREVVTTWTSTLSEVERQHMDVCAQCLGVFVEEIDEYCGEVDKES